MRFFLFIFIAAEYIIQCRRSDPQLLDCLKGSLHHLRPYLAQGIPEIEVCHSVAFIRDILIIPSVAFSHCIHQQLICSFLHIINFSSELMNKEITRRN